MAYYTGSAANLAAVLSALTTACVDEGWTWSDNILSKADPGIFVRLDATTEIYGLTPLRMWGRTAIDSGETPYSVCIVDINSIAITYPVTYHVFVFTSEVFMVINYSDKFQWLAFGQSDQPGLGSTGNWIAASVGYLSTGAIHGPPDTINMALTLSNMNSYTYYVAPGFAWGAYYYYGKICQALIWNFWIDAGLDSGETNYPWMQSGKAQTPGILGSVELIGTQPNAFNNEGVLIPIKVFKARSESKYSQVLQVQNARHIRVDNYTPTEVITLGTDQWMVFPWYLKNTATRNAGKGVTHTGTFGWAIKYEPPV